jgi:hypothetical protein
MTTRYEAELQDVEMKLRNPVKSQKVTKAEKTHVKVQRTRERDRDERTAALGSVITCRWVDSHPVKWEVATAEVEIGGRSDLVTIDPYHDIEGKPKLRGEIVRDGYQGAVEKWALWKWHIARGSEVDDADNFILDCQPPAFTWLEPIAPPKRADAEEVEAPRRKPGPKPKIQASA